MLVMIALIVSATVAYSYLASEGTAITIGRNIREQAQARYAAECGLDVGIAAIRGNPNWRTQRPNGTWITDQPVAGGSYTIVGQDGADTNNDGAISVPAEGDGSLSDNPSDPVTLTVTGRSGTCTSVVRAVIPAFGNFGNTSEMPNAERNVAGQQIATQVTIPKDGDLISISLYMDGPPPKDVRFAIYSDVNGQPGSLLAQTALSDIDSNTAHWKSVRITGQPLTLQAGTYWLAFAFDHANMNYYYSDTNGQTRIKNYDAISHGFRSSWGSSDSSNTRKISIYATLAVDGCVVDLK